MNIKKKPKAATYNQQYQMTQAEKEAASLPVCCICRRAPHIEETATHYMIYCPSGCRMADTYSKPEKMQEAKEGVKAKWKQINQCWR